MESMLKDEMFEVDNGNKVKRFVVRCMKRKSKHREGEFGVLDVPHEYLRAIPAWPQP